MKRKLTIFLTLISLSSCSIHKPVDYSEPSNDSETITSKTLEQNNRIHSRLYEVKTTDTLISVARKHATTPQALIELNQLKKPYTIRAGQLIKIPMFSTGDTKQKAEQRVVHISPVKQQTN